MFKVKTRYVFAAILILAMARCIPAAAESETPPGIEKGWNLISITCDSSLEDFKQRLGSDDIEVFEWTGTEYSPVDQLYRGRGYALTSNAVLNSSSICDNQPGEWTGAIHISKGWNLIGNPYHNPVTAGELLRGHADSVWDRIFEYKGNRYREITKDDEIRTWRAVWIYSYSEFDISTRPVCEELVLVAGETATGDSLAIETGDAIQFQAVCVSGESEEVVTGFAEWSNSDPAILSSGDVPGQYAGVSPGTSSVSASYEDISSDPATVTVFEPELERIALTTGKNTLYVRESTVLRVTGYYTTGTARDLTSEAQFELSNPDAGTIVLDEFTAASPGKVEIHALVTDGETVFAASAEISIFEVSGPKLRQISLTASSYSAYTNEKVQLTVTAYYTDNSTKDVTTESEFTVIPEDMGMVTGNDFYGFYAGDATIVARYSGLASSRVIRIKGERPEIEKLVVYAYPSMMEIHEVASITAMAYYSNGSYQYVTNEVDWDYDESMGRLELPTGHFYPSQIGTVTFTASLNGMASDPGQLKIIDKQLIWIGIYKKQGDLTPLPCPSYFGYYFCYNNHYMPLGGEGAYKAVGTYNTGFTEPITNTIETWESSDESVVRVDEYGRVFALKKGLAAVRAYRDGVYSEWSWIQVIDDSTQEFLMLEYSNRETILEKGDTAELNATYYSRVPAGYVSYETYGVTVENGLFSATRVTRSADWSVSDESVGSFDASAAEFTGLSRGTADVSASYNGLQSNSVEMEVWEPAELDYCSTAGDDATEATWTDNKTMARLATNCDRYDRDDEVDIVFEALSDNYFGRRILDVCLDLYIYNSDRELVKTIRHENCSPTPLFRSVDGFTPVYNYSYSWDQKDDGGDAVPRGDYTAVARFYILYCPVLKVDFTIE